MFRLIWSWMLYTWGGLHRYFGNQNTMRREHERAVHYFGRAYAVDPTFTAARVQRAILLSRELGRHDEALAEFDALLALQPDSGEILLNRGLALQANGRFQEALADIENYLQLPNSDEYGDEARRIAAALRDITADLES